MHQESLRRLTANFLSESMEAREQWMDIFKFFKNSNNNLSIKKSYLTKLYFKNEGEIK